MGEPGAPDVWEIANGDRLRTVSAQPDGLGIPLYHDDSELYADGDRDTILHPRELDPPLSALHRSSVSSAASPPAHDDARSPRRLSFWPLVAATFFMVSGGTYGTEDIVHGAVTAAPF